MKTGKNFSHVKMLIVGFMIGYITHAVITGLRIEEKNDETHNTSEGVAKH